MLAPGFEPTAPSAFSFRSERPCLDFAATLMFRGAGAPRELLSEPSELARWAREAAIVSGDPRCDAADLAAAVELREAIYRSAVARIDGRSITAADRELINEWSGGAPPRVSLDSDGTARREGAAPSVLAGVARDAVELLGGDDGARLRQCARDGCTRMFVDRSRGQNRSWCGMRECGNRVNAAAYRRRRDGRS